jgi:CRP/FNR family transcriptional regulator
MSLCRRVEELAGGQVERRIATLLLRLADGMGVPRTSEGTWIPVRLSRQDLADLVGTTLETAIRVMTRLGRAGIVRTAPRGLVITDRRALEEVGRRECGRSAAAAATKGTEG